MTDPRARLPARAPRAVLRELAGLQGRPGVSPPEVTLTLCGGARERGRVIAWSETGGAASLSASGDGQDVVYVAADDVVAARVHYTPQTMHLLSEGRVAAPVPAAPTRLVMKRRVIADCEALAAVVGHPFDVRVPWEALPSEGVALAALWGTLRDAVRVVGALAHDPMGREALAHVHSLELRTTGQPGAGRDGARVWVGIALTDEGEADVPDAETIRRELERAL